MVQFPGLVQSLSNRGAVVESGTRGIGSRVEVADKRPADEAICVRETKGTFFSSN